MPGRDARPAILAALFYLPRGRFDAFFPTKVIPTGVEGNHPVVFAFALSRKGRGQKQRHAAKVTSSRRSSLPGLPPRRPVRTVGHAPCNARVEPPPLPGR